MTEKLNSFEALKQKKADIIAQQGGDQDPIEVRVAMATCAIATGAKEVFDALQKSIENEGLLNVELKSTGCLGYCYAEPTVEVVFPGQDPVTYGFVDAKTAMDIVDSHLKRGEIVQGHTVKTCHVNA